MVSLDFTCETEKGKATENKPKQSISEMLALGQDEAPKNYTPYIKYTKLEFKVHKFLCLLFVIFFCLYVVVVSSTQNSTCENFKDGRRDNC